MERWRHKKRGTVYEVMTDSASLQCSCAPEFEAMFDDDNWTVYRNHATGAVYIRPTEEFLDGRFERVGLDPDGKKRPSRAVIAPLQGGGVVMFSCTAEGADAAETYLAEAHTKRQVVDIADIIRAVSRLDQSE